MKKLMALILTATLVISVGASSAFATEQSVTAKTEEISVQNPAETPASPADEVVNTEKTADSEKISAPSPADEVVNAEKTADSEKISVPSPADEAVSTEKPVDSEEISAPSPTDASVNPTDASVSPADASANPAETPAGPTDELTEEAPESPVVELPNYVGMNESEIEDVLNGENAGNIIVRYVISEEAEGTILAQDTTDDGNVVIQIAQAAVDAENGDGTTSILSSFTLNAEMGDDAPSLANGGWEKYATWYDNDNMDQAESAAKWGAWGGNGNLQGQKYDNAYNNDLSHQFGLYADGDNVHVYIQYSALYNGVANGNDYQIRVDGVEATYRIGLEDGREITWTQLEPGTYNLKVYNDHGSISGSQVLGACGQIIIKENNLHNEMELVIPMTALKDQNDAIDLSSYSVISFFTPNLMQREIACAGASSGPVFFAMMTMIIFLAVLVVANKKGIMELDVVK